MDCGADELFCQLLTWVTENELVAASVAELLGDAGRGASGIYGVIATLLKEHGQAIIGLLGVSFGFFKWWRYREQILHKRLEEYLHENDRRLRDGQTYVLDALQRPGPPQTTKAPLFANHRLRSILRERRWDNAVMAASVESSADWELSKAAEIIERQIRTAEHAIASLREQYATANILRGAIASSSASATAQANSTALAFFRSALRVPGHQTNVVAKELEAHQLRKLGHFLAVQSAYEELEINAPAIDDPKARRS